MRILLVGYDPETVDFSDPVLPPGMTADWSSRGAHRAAFVPTLGYPARGPATWRRRLGAEPEDADWFKRNWLRNRKSGVFPGLAVPRRHP